MESYSCVHMSTCSSDVHTRMCTRGDMETTHRVDEEPPHTLQVKVSDGWVYVAGCGSPDAEGGGVRLCDAPNGAWRIPDCDYTTFCCLREILWGSVCGLTPGEHPAAAEAPVVVLPRETTLGLPNRVRDRDAVVMRLGVLATEAPHRTQSIALLDVDGEAIATGFVQLLLGDHGPYFELRADHVVWDRFRSHILKGPHRHYHEHYRSNGRDGGVLKLYDQFRGVADEPNPPPGPHAVSNHRPEGYAHYQSGCLYVSADDVAALREA